MAILKEALGKSLQIMKMFGGFVGRVPMGHLLYLVAKLRNEKPHSFAGQLRLNSFFPPFPSVAFDRFRHAVIERRRVPLSVYLATSAQCPGRCRHCSYAGRTGTALSGHQFLETVNSIKSLGACTLGFTGGEPLLCPNLEDLISAAGPEMATIVFTTGHMLTEARARRLASAGVTCVTVGLESSDPAVHDGARGGGGSFAAAGAAVGNCRNAGIYVAISTIGTREKIVSGELERMYDLARRWEVGELRVLAPVATGAAAGCTSFMLTPAEKECLSDFHVRHNRQSGGPAVASFAYLESDACFGCGAGYHHLFIDAAGNVSPCDLTPLSFGNVTVEPLAAVWARMGTYFSVPRRGCLMANLMGHLNLAGRSLPIPQTESEAVCSRLASDVALPEGYRRLLKNRKR